MKKGFTLVELITTFALTAVIIVLLLNVVNAIKNIYEKNNIKSELYIYQSNLSNVLNEKIKDDNLLNYEICTDDNYLLCVDFTFVEGENARLTVEEKQIKFGEVIYKLEGKTSVVNPSFNVEYESEGSKEILVLKIPIINELYPEIDFGINLVYNDFN